MLPDMRLLMHQGRADVPIAPVDEAIGIERQLVPTGFDRAASEAIGTEIAERVRFSKKGPAVTMIAPIRCCATVLKARSIAYMAKPWQPRFKSSCRRQA
jgi:hypothetical protein